MINSTIASQLPENLPELAVVIPAAGIGKRMQAKIPKQYLKINNQTLLEHSINAFIDLPFVSKVVVPIAEHDNTFSHLSIASHPKLIKVSGGKERADSVLSALDWLNQNNYHWLMVHDAARPCVSKDDIVNLYQCCLRQNQAGILAAPVRDTMKRSSSIPVKASNNQLQKTLTCISETVDRDNLWHALTPQCCTVERLYSALTQQIDEQGNINNRITDEASAIERLGDPVLLVEGSVKNIKVTHPEDLALAQFYTLTT